MDPSDLQHHSLVEGKGENRGPGGRPMKMPGPHTTQETTKAGEGDTGAP